MKDDWYFPLLHLALTVVWDEMWNRNMKIARAELEQRRTVLAWQGVWLWE